MIGQSYRVNIPNSVHCPILSNVAMLLGFLFWHKIGKEQKRRRVFIGIPEEAQFLLLSG